MNKFLHSIVLSLIALLPVAASAFEQLAEGVYSDGSTLYIGSGVTSLGPLQVNPSVVYSFAAVPPACEETTFLGYAATLHMPSTSYGSYFLADYWCNFATMENNAVEPTGLTLSVRETEMYIGAVMNISATVLPANASTKSVDWSSTNPEVATVIDGNVTAVNVGECDIVASCLDKQSVCHVQVLETTIQISLDRHEAKLLPNHALMLIPSMTPLATDLKVTSTNPQVAAARIMNGVIQVVGLTEGTTMVIVNSVDEQAIPDSCEVTVYTEVGDVNCDGYVTIADVSKLIDYLLVGESSPFSETNADCNHDESVTIKDVTLLIDYLLGLVDLNPPVTETFTVNGVSFTMVAVEGGAFIMGGTSEQGVEAIDNELPTHQVTLSSYRIGETEVTQELWIAVMGNNPSNFTNGVSRPVEKVSWNDCQAFIAKLNELTGMTFRLPTEAEWEYAARGGNKSNGYKYAGSDDVDEVAWYMNNSLSMTQPVASKAPNELGLYDMSGNVWEWCQDYFGSYSSEPQSNPTGPATGTVRVFRGGCWTIDSWYCRVSFRLNNAPTLRSNNLGFRLAL